MCMASKSPSIAQWVRAYPSLEYYTAEKKNNDILNFAGKWMEVENIILSEVTQKGNYHMYSLIGGF